MRVSKSDAGFRPHPALQAMQAKVSQVRTAPPSAFRPNPALMAIQAKMAQAQNPPPLFRPNLSLQSMQGKMRQTPGGHAPAPPAVATAARFVPNPALQAAQAKVAQFRVPAMVTARANAVGNRPGASACGCSSSSCSCGHKAARRALPVQRQAVQRQVIQRSQSDSDFERAMTPESEDISDDAACAEDNCIDVDCNVKDSYSTTTGQARPLGQTIRARFYPAFTTATQYWAAGRMNALQGNCGATQYRCEHCNQCVLKSNASLDHVTPVATHWNTAGRNTDQNTRFQWYNDTNNLEVVDRNHNSSMGSGGVNYRRDVGQNFSGGPNC